MRHPLIAKKKSWFYSPILAVVLLVLVVWTGIATFSAFQKQHEAIELRDEAVREKTDLMAKQNDLNQKIQNLSTDEGMEAEVRERYRVVKPGEQLVIVVDNKDPNASPTTPPTFWQKVKEFVGF